MVSYLHFVPTAISVTLQMSAMTTWVRHGAPFLMGGRGSDPEGTDTRFVSWERPVPWSIDRDKKAMERLHLERFRVDCRARGEGDWITNAVYNPSGPDARPDFFVVPTASPTPVGLECTQYALRERREALALLHPVRAEILARPRAEFRHLQGMAIFLRFVDDSSSVALPFPMTARKRISRLANLIAEHRPNPNALVHEPGASMPNHAPDIGVATNDDGAAIHAVPLPGGIDPSRFMGQTGFELDLAFTTTHTPDTEWDRLLSLVKRKDKPDNDWLLITAGGPDRTGNIHPAEEIAAEVLIDNPRPVATNELARVLLHRWAAGDIWELTPTPRRVVDGIPMPLPSLSPNETAVDYPTVVSSPGLIVARNDECPCGRGRKWKHCHGQPW
ncbi:MAG: hypothetical protein QOG87_1344 [Actinomycetota bacterium]|jgi:hypothetical protein